MTGYIVPEYEEIDKSLLPFLKEHDLDAVSLSSLIRGSIEILEPEAPTASVAVIDTENMASGLSVKFKNIKVNLKFALNSIFSYKSVFNTEGIWFVLAILRAIVFLLEETEIRLSINEATVLFCLYRLQSATPQEIVGYAEKLKQNGKEVDIQEREVVEALNNLEEIRTVKLESGRYFLCESVWIRKF